ncbi:MAG: aspartate 1-decarboxylase [Legionella sp.]|nr:MAG: aspartate 1-decarboxylase [Legionella sp.]
MKRTFLYAKLHQATVTQADLNYEGSFSIDEELLQLSGIQENEQIHVLNITNGHRFVTYAITAPRKSRMMCANGACAHLVNIGDRVIICAYTDLEAHEIPNWEPTVLFLDHNNDYKIKPRKALIQERDKAIEFA